MYSLKFNFHTLYYLGLVLESVTVIWLLFSPTLSENFFFLVVSLPLFHYRILGAMEVKHNLSLLDNSLGEYEAPCIS